MDVIWYFLVLSLDLILCSFTLTLCNPMNYTVHGILQARILEWVACPFSRGSSLPRRPRGLLHCRRILYQLSYKGSHKYLFST